MSTVCLTHKYTQTHMPCTLGSMDKNKLFICQTPFPNFYNNFLKLGQHIQEMFLKQFKKYCLFIFLSLWERMMIETTGT